MAFQRITLDAMAAARRGFPMFPVHGQKVLDRRNGIIWIYNHPIDDSLGSLGLGQWETVIGIGSKLLGSILGIFGAHAAKVQREDQISGAWAAQGPMLIEQIKQAYASGQMSASDASSALDSLENQFRQNAQQISKYNGKFGMFPDVNAPRPSSNCNWACGTSWELHQQILGIKAGMTGGSSGGGLGLDSNTLMLIAGGVLLFMMLN
jgi:hypothetical protein